MDEYYCPNCNAILNEQEGFDPDNGSWTCAVCGTHLMDDDVYDGDTFEGVAWYCDSCGALLNRQDGFSDSYGSWECTECGYLNGTTESDIINDGPQCPECDCYLRKQSGYSDYEEDWVCEECGAQLHRDYSSDPYESVSEDDSDKCPECGCSLEEQWGYGEYQYDWRCHECGAKLHRNFSDDPYEVVDNDNADDDDDDDTDVGVAAAVTLAVLAKAAADKYNNSKFASKYRKRKRIKRFLVWFFGVLAIVVLAALLQGGYYILQQRIPMEFSFDSLEGMEYTEAVRVLKESGFKNVRAKEIEDLPLARENEKNIATNIWMSWGWLFNDDTQFPIHMRITVEYHTLKLFNPPITSKDAKEEQYNKIVEDFEKAGFTNITVQVEHDLLNGWIIDEGSVKSITIDGDKNYYCSDEYRPDAEVIITYHAFRNEKQLTGENVINKLPQAV